MKKEFYIQVLNRLVQMAVDCQRTNVEEHEPAFFAVLAYVSKADVQLQKEAELAFIRMVEERKSEPYQVIGYCMRELQFPLLRAKVTALMDEAYSKNDHRYAAVLSNILRDYDSKDGDPEELYSYYRNKRINAV
jgi:hypothetical protein